MKPNWSAVAALVLLSCGGRLSESAAAGDPCALPPAWDCADGGAYQRCTEPDGLGWVIFPDGTAWREVRARSGVVTIKCDLAWRDQ